MPPVRPPDDHWLLAQLAALRETDHLLGRARSAGASSAATLERDRDRLEARVRAATLRVRGADGRADGCGDGRGDDRADGRDDGREDGRDDGSAPGGGRFLVAVGGGELLAAIGGGRLERALLGPVADRLSDGRSGGELIVVPPATLHGAPWGLLPALRRRAFSVAPSAAAWLRARTVVPPADGGVVLVRGPGVAHADGEVRSIAELYAEAAEPAAGRAVGQATEPATDSAAELAAEPAAGPDAEPATEFAAGSATVRAARRATARTAGPVTVLVDGSATAQGVLEAIDGCHLAHLAAHGTFRADSPSFSSLLLDDGPLTVYDLERLRRAPYRLVLSSCDSGQVAAVGADEVLGPATALLHLGTAGIVASVVPVNDAAAVPLMVALHDGLRRGLGLAEALSEARGDDVSFIAIGAG